MSRLATSPPGAPAVAPVRLLIVDDQPLIRRGLALMLADEPGISVVGQAADGVEAVEQALRTRPDVVVMDLRMPRASGVIATREIVAQLPGTRVLVLSTYDDDELVFEAVRAGAQAYLLKDTSEAEVLDTIRAVHRGEARLSPAIARKVMAQFRSLAAAAGPSASTPDAAAPASGAPAPGLPPVRPGAPPEEPLTERESRVLELVSQGLSNREIAAAVFLAEGTVKNHVSRILDKLHARNRLELAVRNTGGRG